MKRIIFYYFAISFLFAMINVFFLLSGDEGFDVYVLINFGVALFLYLAFFSDMFMYMAFGFMYIVALFIWLFLVYPIKKTPYKFYMKIIFFE